MSNYSFNGKIDWKYESFKRVIDHIDKHIFGYNNYYKEAEKEKWEEVFKHRKLNLEDEMKSYQSLNDDDKITSPLFSLYVAKANEIVDDYKYFYVKENKNSKSINFVDKSNFNTCIQLNKNDYPVIATCFYRSHLNEDSVIISFAYEKAMGNANRINTNNKALIKALFKKPLEFKIKNHIETSYRLLYINNDNKEEALNIFSKPEQDVLSYIYFYLKEKSKYKSYKISTLYKAFVNKIGILFGYEENGNIDYDFDDIHIEPLVDRLCSYQIDDCEFSYDIDEYLLSSLLLSVVKKEYYPINNKNIQEIEYFKFYQELIMKVFEVLR